MRKMETSFINLMALKLQGIFLYIEKKATMLKSTCTHIQNTQAIHPLSKSISL